MEAVDHYRAAAANHSAPDMEPVFLEAATEYEKFAAELAAYIRAHDDQPKLPDPDKETLGLLFTSLKAKLASDERQTLIEDQARTEQKLCEAVNAALQSGLPPEIRPLLERMLAQSNSMTHILSK
jgi:uncharacterized protein (TIGR02284 family)